MREEESDSDAHRKWEMKQQVALFYPTNLG